MACTPYKHGLIANKQFLWGRGNYKEFAICFNFYWLLTQKKSTSVHL